MPTLPTLLLTLLLAVLSFGLCTGALALRRTQGLAPLMLLIGMLEGLKYHVAAWLWIDWPGFGPVALGSLVSYINLLALMLVVHLRAGLESARALAWGVIAISLISALFNQLFFLLAHQSDVQLRLLQRVDHLQAGIWVLGVGNVLLLLGLVGTVLLVEWLRQRRVPLGLALVLSLQLVVQLDTLLFITLAFGPQALTAEALSANALGKGLMALLFALLAWVALARQQGQALPVLARGRLLALLGAYSFRQRLESLELELQTDPLTGLFNRRYLERTVPDILRLDRQRGDPTALLLLDLDHFKALNDRHGHLVGDQALRHVAVLLQQGVRHHDSVIRFGGEEFIVLLPSTDAAAATAVAEQLLARLRAQPLQLGSGEVLPLAATIGVALSPADGSLWPALLACADERLYTGKRAGRSRVVSAQEPGEVSLESAASRNRR